MNVFHNTITPVLTVRDAVTAVNFYKRAFDAQEIYRNTYPDGRIVAEMAVGAARFRVADEAPDASNLSPEALKGTTVRLNLFVADPDTIAHQPWDKAPPRSRQLRIRPTGYARDA